MYWPLVRAAGRAALAVFAVFVVAAGLFLGACSGSEPSRPPSAPAGSTDGGDDGAAVPDASDAGADDCGVPAAFQWSSTGPILSPMSDATHDLVAIKDPSVVYYSGKWHVFVSTVNAAGAYNLAYISFADWTQTSSATFQYLDMNPRLGGYHAAPQVFFFAPQNKWYLVFQSGPPTYSTNTDITDVQGWTQPTGFFATEPAVVLQNQGTTGGWLDFWTICDTANCYLFFSDDNGTWYRSQTTLGMFPNGFGNTVVVMQQTPGSELFEASNVYYMKGTGKYLALVEAYDQASMYHRFFKSWTADTLDGTWTPLQDTYSTPFASTANVTFPTFLPWTGDISHGEMIRDSFDQSLTIDTCSLQYLYQGYATGSPTSNYNGIPWQLALLTKTN